MWDQALEPCLTSLRTLVWSWNKTFGKTVRLPERRSRALLTLYAMNATDPVRQWKEYIEDLPNSTDMSVKEAGT